MGESESKEEVIISQAGNSGGATANNGFSLVELSGVVAAGFVIVAIVAYCYCKDKKMLKSTVRREIQRSQIE